MKSTKPPKIFYLILLLIPILFLILLELSLNLFGYGKDLGQWYSITEEKQILNPDIGARYFSKIKNYPHSNHDSFYKEKKKNSLRIFVFGGSSTAGFPFQPNGSFTRYIRDRLKLDFPDKTIEVINLGITAVNTYTIKDLLPGVIEQNPDLVIFYAGHNEYYGALGVGSTQTFGSNKFLIDNFLYFKKFKTTQLVSKIIKSTIGLYSEKKKGSKGSTLMARMASEQAIVFGSEIYNSGVKQFKRNLNDILHILKENKIPTLVGTLVSKSKDQEPFISLDQDKNLSASNIYSAGIQELEAKNFYKADSLLLIAKDLDGLRFRAPSKFNTIITELSKKYNAHVIDIEKQFKLKSKDRIVGNDLMVDHLHPTLEGHFLIGDLFYEEIINQNIFDNSLSFKNVTFADSIVTTNFNFTKLDSISAQYRIYNLLNDWPFVKDKLNTKKKYLSNTFIDSLGFRIVNENLNWEIAHQKAYKHYLDNNDLKNFAKEMKVLISQYPYKYDYYNFAAQELLFRKEYDQAQYFLEERYKLSPDEFSVKWLSNIYLNNNSIKKAIKFYNESIQFNPSDSQVFYNLAVAYLKMNDLDEALKNVRKSLRIKPNYPNAIKMEQQLSLKIKKPTL